MISAAPMGKTSVIERCLEKAEKKDFKAYSVLSCTSARETQGCVERDYMCLVPCSLSHLQPGGLSRLGLLCSALRHPKVLCQQSMGFFFGLLKDPQHQLIFRDQQIKTSKRFHFASFRKATVKIKKNATEEMEKLDLFDPLLAGRFSGTSSVENNPVDPENET